MHFSWISASCLSTACLASGIFRALIIIVIVTSHYFHDTLATLITANLGDLIMLRHVRELYFHPRLLHFLKMVIQLYYLNNFTNTKHYIGLYQKTFCTNTINPT